MVEMGDYSIGELRQMHEQYCCLCDESAMYDRFLIVEKAEGLYVWFKDEKEPYLDLVMGYAALNFGHRHPQVTEAVEEANKSIDHIHSFNCESRILLSKILAEKAPGPSNKRVYYPVGGAMAVETSIKLARAYTGKTKIASFKKAFHGYSYSAMMVTDESFINKRQYVPFPGEVIWLPYADCYNCEKRSDCSFQCLREAELLLGRDKDIAAMVVEPVQGAAGFVVPPKDFIAGLKKLCRDNDVLFIDDEIQVGLGRTGRMYAIEHFNVEPDIILLGKSLSGGSYPLSAVIAREEIWDCISPTGSAIGSTFANNPFGTYIALQAQRILEEEHLIENAGEIGSYFTEELRRLERFKYIDNVTGLGLTQSFDVVKSKDTRAPAPEIARKIQSEALKRRMIIYVGGADKNRIKLTLPLWIKEEDIDMIVEGLTGVLKTVVGD